jgi:hypothetical protein
MLLDSGRVDSRESEVVVQGQCHGVDVLAGSRTGPRWQNPATWAVSYRSMTELLHWYATDTVNFSHCAEICVVLVKDSQLGFGSTLTLILGASG